MPTFIGLDLGKHTFRAVEVTKDTKKDIYILEKALVCDSCGGNDPKAVEENLKNFISEANFSTKNVCLAIPESQVFSTILTLPFSTEKEVQGYLEIEGNKIFPKPLSQLVYSFEILGPSESDSSQTDISVVASAKDYVQGLFELAKAANLNVLSVESEAYSIVRSLTKGQQMDRKDSFIIVNVGSAGSDIMVVKGGFVRFSRNISIGGDTFAKVIAGTMGITEEQSREYVSSYGLNDAVMEGKVASSVKPVVENLISEIKRTINYYISRNAFVEFKKVIYSGSSSVMPGLMVYSAESLGMEVELANPFLGMKFSPSMEKNAEQLVSLGPLYTVSVGLALKELV